MNGYPGQGYIFRRIALAMLLVMATFFWRAASASELVIHSGGERHLFTVEIADTPDARARGLMFRKSLAGDAGMLFIYPRKERVSMWMKDTYISLDMLFLDDDGTVLHIAERAVPHSTGIISSRRRVRAVLELPGGTVQRLNISNGDHVGHPLLDRAG